MKWNNFGMGVVATLMILTTIGMALAAVVAPGSTINVPAGFNAFYGFISSDYNDEVRDAAIYWDGMNTSKTTTEAYVDLNNYGVTCLREWVVSGHKRYDKAMEPAPTVYEPISE